MKKWILAPACLLLALSLTVPVYAQGTQTGDGPPPDEDEAIVVYDWGTGQPVSETTAVGTGQIGGPAATDIRMEMVGAVPYITRYYEFEDDIGLAEVPQGFEQDGYTFTRHDVLKNATSGTVDTKQVSKTDVLPSEGNDAAVFIQSTDREMQYDEGGYTGILTLDVAAIRFEEGERSSYSYALTETREYPGLLSNDASYIDKTITKNGATLYLDSIEWQVMGTSPTDGGLVPTQYKGIATYSGRGTGSRVSSYTAYVTYSGEVERVTPGKTVYAVIFRGQPIPVAAPETVAEEKQASFLWLYCIIAVLAIGGVAAYVCVRKRGGERCTDGLFGNIWEGRDDDDDDFEPVYPATPPAADIPTSVFDVPVYSAPEPVREDSKADTASSILAAIEGMEDDIPTEKPKRRGASRKDTIPLVEKVED